MKSFSSKKKGQDQDLSVEISFLEGLRHQMPEDTEVLKQLGDAYTKAGCWEEGLEMDLELSQYLPRDPGVHYNLACSFSLLGQLKKSSETLVRAISLGYCDWDWLMEDPDLDNLRKSPEFERVMSLKKDPLGKRT